MQITGRLIICFVSQTAKPVDMPTAIAANSTCQLQTGTEHKLQFSTEHSCRYPSKITVSPQRT